MTYTGLLVAVAGALVVFVPGVMIWAYGRGERNTFISTLSDAERNELAGYMAAGASWRDYRDFRHHREIEKLNEAASALAQVSKEPEPKVLTSRLNPFSFSVERP